MSILVNLKLGIQFLIDSFIRACCRREFFQCNYKENRVVWIFLRLVFCPGWEGEVVNSRTWQESEVKYKLIDELSLKFVD